MGADWIGRYSQRVPRLDGQVMTDTPINLFVSGRLCLFGEHADWAADLGNRTGHCIVVGTDQGLKATAEKADEFIIETVSPTGRVWFSSDWNKDSLLASATDPNEFFRYCTGVAHEVLVAYGSLVGGLKIQITEMTLPLKSGVSSSAAVCVLVAKAFNQVYNLKRLPSEIMKIAHRGETLTGSQCGQMDQACIYGKTVVLLTFPGDSGIQVEPLAVGNYFPMFIVDLAGKKDTVQILHDLQAAYERDMGLRDILHRVNSFIVREAYSLLQSGDVQNFGRLMSEAQLVFDTDVAKHCPEQLASPLLHEVLQCRDIADFVYGGKGVGSQGDGTAQFVAKSPADRIVAMMRLQERFPKMRCFPLDIGKR